MPTEKQKNHPSGQVVSVRLEPEVIERLDRLAARTHRSRGTYLRTAISAVLPVLEKQHWEQTLVQYEQGKLEREFMEVTQQLMEQEDTASRSQSRRWQNPSEPLE